MNETLKTIHSLRSIHGRFDRAKEVSDSDLKTILEASVRAATASARQSYFIIVVDDKQDMRDYLQYVGSKALIFCVDYSRLAATADCLGYRFESAGLIDFITGSTDTILAAQTAAIAAKSLGIDSLFTNSVHRGDFVKFYEKFALPTKGCFPLIALILGYPAEPDHPQRGRLNGPEIIHYRKYQPVSDEAVRKITADYDDPAKNLGLVFRPDDRRSHYMDWFFNVWCRPDNTEKAKLKQHEIYRMMKKARFLEQEYLE